MTTRFATALASLVIVLGGCVPKTERHAVLAGVPKSPIDNFVRERLPLTPPHRSEILAFIKTKIVGRDRVSAFSALSATGFDCSGGNNCLFAIDYPEGERELPSERVGISQPGAIYNVAVYFPSSGQPKASDEFGRAGLTE